MVKELVEQGLIAKYEDLKDILERSASSAERCIKQSIESRFLKENDWREWKQKAKNSPLSRQERIEKGLEYVKNHFKVMVNESGRGGRYLVERDNFSYPENPDFQQGSEVTWRDLRLGGLFFITTLFIYMVMIFYSFKR